MKNNMIYLQRAFKIVGKTCSEDKSSTAWEQEQANHYFHSQAHNINLWTNNKVITQTCFWSFDICSAASSTYTVGHQQSLLGLGKLLKSRQLPSGSIEEAILACIYHNHDWVMVIHSLLVHS